MRNMKISIYQIIGTAIISLMLVTDRLWHIVPDWLALILALVSAVLIGVGLYRTIKAQEKNR